MKSIITRRVFARLILLLIATAVGRAIWLRNLAETKPQLMFGQLRFSSAVLLQLAERNGYIEREGLAYRAVNFPAGPDVLNGLRAISGNNIVAGNASTTPIANWIGAGGKPVIIACVYSSHRHAQVLTFAKTNITVDPQTLKAKRIGLARNTLADVYLETLLSRGSISKRDIVLVGAKPPDLKSMLLRGDLDAAIIWDPFIVQAKREYLEGMKEKKYPDRGELLSLIDPSVYRTRVFVVTSTDHLAKNRASLVKLLRALKNASDSVEEDRIDAQRKTEEWLGLEQGDLTTEFNTAEYRLSLNIPELSSILRTDLEWVSQAFPDAVIPKDLSPYFDASLLREVAPEVVRN